MKVRRQDGLRLHWATAYSLMRSAAAC